MDEFIGEQMERHVLIDTPRFDKVSLKTIYHFAFLCDIYAIRFNYSADVKVCFYCVHQVRAIGKVLYEVNRLGLSNRLSTFFLSALYIC